MQIVCGKDKNHPTAELFHDLKALPVNDLIKLELAKFGYKITRNLYPEPITKIMNTRGGMKTHQYPTHRKGMPNIQRHQTPLFNKSFLCKGITRFNELPDKLRETNSLTSFTKNLKKHLQGL